MNGAMGGYAVRPTFGIRLHRRSTGRAGASFSNPCCGLEIQPIRETNLGCGMKRSSTCFPSIYLSIYLHLSLPSTRCGGMSRRLLCSIYVCLHERPDENREIIAEVQHVRCKCSLYDLTDSNLEINRHRKHATLCEDKLQRKLKTNRLI